MPATNPDVLLDESKCLGCASNATMYQRLKLALLDRISAGPVSPWILETGVWNDLGIWVDSDVWEDS